MGHVIEHIDPADVGAVFREAVRVSAGWVGVVCPDPGAADLPGHAHEGRGRWDGDDHAWLPDSDDLLAVAADAGLDGCAHRWDELPAEWPVPLRVNWQYGVSVRA